MEPAPREAFASFLRESSDSLPFAAADTLWPLMYPFLDESTRGRAKFVLWRRNATEWAQSYTAFFNGVGINGNDTSVCVPNDAYYNTPHKFMRFRLLSYGAGCFAAEDVPHLARAYEAHIEAVLRYFHATPERRRRFLDVDFTAPDAGRTLCSFVSQSDDSAPDECEAHSDMPDVPPSHLDNDWAALSGSTMLTHMMNERVFSQPRAKSFKCGGATVS